MPRLSLTSGAYSAESIIASAQRSINLYPEKNPEEIKSPSSVTHYPRPGLTPIGAPANPAPGRGLYTATNGDLYAVSGQNIHYINPDFVFSAALGQLLNPATSPVYMADNGSDILIVDGSPQGYDINMATRIMSLVQDVNFVGADRVDFLDTFLVYNLLGTNQWGSTLSQQLAFSGLNVGVKSAWPDKIVAIITVEREVWILGPYKGEIWYNAGTVPFPFQSLPGVIIEQGCAAKYSVAKMDTSIYWLSQSPEGARMIMRGNGHCATRISTHAIENEFRKYRRVDDAIGSCYQINGHSFYKLSFPAADKCWVFDEATQQWHEDNFVDINGVLRRSRAPFCAYAYGRNVALDFQSSQLYQIDPDNFSDNGSPLVCIRSFPQVMPDDFSRATFWQVIADMEVGNGPGLPQMPTAVRPWSLGFSPGFGPVTIIEPPLISMRVSSSRGASWDNARMQPLGAQGQYLTRPTWRRLGLSTDMVIEFSWSTPIKTALNGAFLVDAEMHEE